MSLEAFRRWIGTPYREWRRFCRALDVTTRATCNADAFLALMDRDWNGEGAGQLEEEQAGMGELVNGPVETNTWTEIAIVAPDGELGELAPDMPTGPLMVGEGLIGRRAAAFRRYWVARVHCEYPRVVGNWDEAALGCTKLYLCKAMREPRRYYVMERQRDGSERLAVRYKQGMTVAQVAHCVDWVVTAAHTGTPAQATQRAVQMAMKPNWLMRLCGLRAVGYPQ